MWRKISDVGVSDTYPLDKKKEIIGFNQISFLAFLIILPYFFPLYVFFPDSNACYWTIGLNTLFLGTLFLNHKRKHEWAKIHTFLVANILLFWSCRTFGTQFGVQFGHILLIYGIILYSQVSKKPMRWIPLVFSFLNVFIVHFTNFNPFMEKVDVPENLTENFTFLNLMILMVLAMFLSRQYAVVNYLNFRIIEQSKIDLEEQYNQLEKLNTELDRFVYSVSHDLRSPIASVLGLISISKEETDLEKLQYYISLKEKSMEKLDRFIQDILDYSRNSRMESKIQEINLTQKIASVLELQEFPMKKIDLKQKVIIRQHCPFYSDEGRFTFILNNLITNAIRYYEPNRIQSFIKIYAYVTATQLILKIKDNGIGIGANHLDKIFDMFYRATTQQTGSGLGLYILKEAVTKLNGSVSVASVIDEGTCFTITLPNHYLSMYAMGTQIKLPTNHQLINS
ncbi:MAG: HAMP domain-containing histidine kinase [Verrucomicrobia bacterium]|nr:HAMP domain-containing histidine kinase [Cytophagales bacterium]